MSREKALKSPGKRIGYDIHGIILKGRISIVSIHFSRSFDKRDKRGQRPLKSHIHLGKREERKYCKVS